MMEQLISKIEESLRAYTKEFNGSLKKRDDGYALEDKSGTIAVVILQLSISNQPYQLFVDRIPVGVEIDRRLKSLFKEIPNYAKFMQ